MLNVNELVNGVSTKIASIPPEIRPMLSKMTELVNNTEEAKDCCVAYIVRAGPETIGTRAGWN